MKQFQVDESNGIPLWIQVRKRLIYCIVSGHYKPGEQLPTVRELAAQLEINYNTVNKVYQNLERDGYIVTRRGRGTFVADIETVRLLALDSKFELLADELVQNGFEQGMTGEEVVQVVKKRVAHHESLQDGAGRTTVEATAANDEARKRRVV
jgi:GntR family transcriptional regulator